MGILLSKALPITQTINQRNFIIIMKNYIGIKRIKAKPMNRLEYNEYRGWELPADEDGADEGMLVEYLDGGKSNHPNHEGYISWSPKDVFERAYKEGEGIGDASDGYHTFNELYYHRAILFASLQYAYTGLFWKSKLHSDGTMFENYFIVGCDTPHGMFSYHFHIDEWPLFDCKELPKAPEWDGHTSKDVSRLLDLDTISNTVKNLTFGQALEVLKAGGRVARKGWNGKGMFLFLLPANDNIPTKVITDPALKKVIEDETGRDTFDALGAIRMWTADKKVLTGWLASQTDMLSDDWEVVE